MKNKVRFFIAALLVFIISIIFVLFFENTANDADRKLSDLNKKNSPAQMALMRAEHEFERTRDPGTNRLPANIKAREMAYAATLPNVNSAKHSRPELQSVNWVNRGPSNVSGRMKCIEFD